MFMNMKVNILKEIAEKIEKNDLMTDELKDFFEKQYEECKEHSKLFIKTLNKVMNKKKSTTTSNEDDDDSKSSLKKEKRQPTEHQFRVSKCMTILKKKFPYVKHQIILGTSNYMATYIKNEINDIDFENESERVEQAVEYATKQMNDKKCEDIFTYSPVDSPVEEDTNNEHEDEKITSTSSSSTVHQKHEEKKKKKSKKSTS